jgi:hypothetical protein
VKLFKHFVLPCFTSHREKILNVLNLQEFLLYHGVGIRTQILDVQKEDCPLKDYTLLRIKAMLRVKGKMVCLYVSTFLKEREIPKIGDKVLIRYSPKELPYALIVV